LAFLAAAVNRLQADFGSLQTPWGQINRFQRNNGDIVQTFDDTKPSIAVMFGSAQWGSLSAFESRAYPETKRW
jgi:acyl-homoserine-lactone acylase